MPDNDDIDYAFLDELRLRAEGGTHGYPFQPLDRVAVLRLFQEVDKIERRMITAVAQVMRLEQQLEEMFTVPDASAWGGGDTIDPKDDDEDPDALQERQPDPPA